MPTPHPAHATLRTYTWHATQAAAMDRALAGLILIGASESLVSSQRAALIGHLASLDAAHLALKRALCGA